MMLRDRPQRLRIVLTACPESGAMADLSAAHSWRGGCHRSWGRRSDSLAPWWATAMVAARVRWRETTAASLPSWTHPSCGVGAAQSCGGGLASPTAAMQGALPNCDCSAQSERRRLRYMLRNRMPHTAGRPASHGRNDLGAISRNRPWLLSGDARVRLRESRRIAPVRMWHHCLLEEGLF